MINLLVSIAAGLLGFAIFRLVGLSAWQSVLPGIAATVAAFWYLTRRAGKLLEAVGEQVQKELQQRKFDAALALFEKAKPLGRWQFLVGPQLEGQIGTLLYIQKKFDEAEPHLKAAYGKSGLSRSLLRMGTPHAMLAAQHYRRKEWSQMEQVFEGAISANKAEGLLYAVYAWCQDKRGESKKAVEVLQRGLKENAGDVKLKTLLDRAQNDKRLKMDAYGEMWWQFWLESPPMAQQGGFGGGGFGLRGMRGGGRRMR